MSHHSTKPLSPGLYIVATPIGNLGDVTLRAAEVLKGCDAVACEDTRVTGKLMKHIGSAKPLWRYDDHASERDRARIVEAARTQAIALVSDAGTPLVSDPDTGWCAMPVSWGWRSRRCPVRVRRWSG